MHLRDHPRSRGEYCGSPDPEDRQAGSSPLSRGILGDSLGQPRTRRIIPALAGNTWDRVYGFEPAKDHPRSRGEYARSTSSQLNRPDVRGSSPLSRGIRNQPRCLQDRSRIIPALAGNTSGRVLPVLAPRDHPRSRGEYMCLSLRLRFASGSSPLSRGIPAREDSVKGFVGIIPALAGNTW